MARLSDARATIAENRLRYLVRRGKRPYAENLKKWAGILGVQPRSVERYLQRRGDTRRRLRQSEMKVKIDRAFRRRLRILGPRFIADRIIRRGQYVDVTKYMIGILDNDPNPVAPLLDGPPQNGSVFIPNRRLPRLYFEARGKADAPRQGLSYGRVLVTIRRPDGSFVEEGVPRDINTSDNASNTFGYVNLQKELGIRQEYPNDQALEINYAYQNLVRTEAGQSDVITIIAFAPREATRYYGEMGADVGTSVKNRFLKYRKSKTETKQDGKPRMVPAPYKEVKP